MKTTQDEQLVSQEKIREMLQAILERCDVEKNVSEHVVEGLVQTSLRGVDSHGVRLFPHYIRALKAGRINGRPNYSFDQTGASTGKLDGDNTFGHAAGAQAMGHCIRLAEETGIGAVAVFNSTHFGAAAYYGLMAAERDMMGISMTHADALMLTANGKDAFFGTNPICVTAPVEGEEPFCLDMATSTITWNKVLMHRNSSKALPEGSGADDQGKPTTDPHKVKSLMPIGDYKGFGLAMVIDIFCGLLTGGPFGKEIMAMYTTPIGQKRHLGQFFMTINIEKFVSTKEFKKRLKTYIDDIRRQEPKDPARPVMVPGDPEKKIFKKRIKEGIPFSVKDFEKIEELEKDTAKGSGP